jgi:hypothetical protein
VTQKTPFESYFKAKPDLLCLKLFGSRVCVKRSSSRRSKLDRHNFKGIFLGYTATDQNIIYLDLDSGVVKTSHHAQFDEAWYLQSSRPPAAQLLYDLGIVPEEATSTDTPPNVCRPVVSPPGFLSTGAVPWPPMAPKGDVEKRWMVPVGSRHLHPPLRLLMDAPPRSVPARAARTKQVSRRNLAAELV